MSGNALIRVRCGRQGCRYSFVIDERLLDRGKVVRVCRCGAENVWDGRAWRVVVAVDSAVDSPRGFSGEDSRKVL